MAEDDIYGFCKCGVLLLAHPKCCLCGALGGEGHPEVHLSEYQGRIFCEGCLITRKIAENGNLLILGKEVKKDADDKA